MLNNMRPCLQEPINSPLLDTSIVTAAFTNISPELLDEQISDHPSGAVPILPNMVTITKYDNI